MGNRSQDGAGRRGQGCHQDTLGRVEEDNKAFVVPQLDKRVVGYLVDIAGGHTDLGHTRPVQLLPDLEHG